MPNTGPHPRARDAKYLTPVLTMYYLQCRDHPELPSFLAVSKRKILITHDTPLLINAHQVKDNSKLTSCCWIPHGMCS